MELQYKSDYLNELFEKFKKRSLERNTMEYTKRMEKAKKETVKFYNGYFDAMKEFSRVTKNTICVVIGNRRIGEEFIDNLIVTREILEQFGWKMIKNYYRVFTKKRLPMMEGYGGLLNKENTLIFRD